MVHIHNIKFIKKIVILSCQYNLFIYVTGFQWHRQLVFRSKLTMHTAYDRKDNTEPASITCISISK